jgi:CDP-diglyceride synthetase
VSSVAFAAFFFGFWSLGLWPFMLFLGAVCALALFDWSSFQAGVSFFALVFALFMTGAMATLLYFVYLFFTLSPVIAAYPFLCVWVHDVTKFLVQSLLGRSCQTNQISYEKRLVGMLGGIGALTGFNWYVLQHWNPLAFLNFPISYYALFGFSVMISVLIVMGKLFMRRSLGSEDDHQDGCPPISSVSFAKFFGSYLLFAYLIALISFGRTLLS